MIVSVLMSVYNEPKEWLISSINSILNQSFSDFEFIIINDNPTRPINSIVLNSYAISDSRVKIFENKSNIGLTKSLNKGLKLAEGKYIARMDADDISLPDRFFKQVTFLDSNKEYVVCGTNFIKINKFKKKKKTVKLPESDTEIRNRLVLSTPMGHPTIMFRKSTLNRNNLFYDESLKYSQDYKFIFELSRLGKLHNLQETLLKYRISENQITKMYSKEQTNYANRIREVIIIETLKKIKINTEISQDFFSVNINSFFKELSSFKYNRHNLTLNSIKLSLLIYGEGHVSLKNYLFFLFSKNNTLVNRLRIIKYFKNVC